MLEVKKELIQNENSFNLNIKIIGVGGGGNNTINSMIKDNIKGVEFIIANTDVQALKNVESEKVIQIGKKSTRGLGAGANPTTGKNSAIESKDDIKKAVQGADLVIVAAGMGGGTGTGAAPIIAKIAKDSGALTIGVVTTPFSFEGSKRDQNAKQGVKEFKDATDSLICVSNNMLLEVFGEMELKEAFLHCDSIIKQTVRTITDLISTPALINLDFRDLTTVIENKGLGAIGIGSASGDNRAEKAALEALSSPLLESSFEGATDAIINVSGSDITLKEANQAINKIKEAVGKDFNIIFGVSILEELEQEIKVSIIATGVKYKNGN